jgi:hypothetical protein
VAHEEDFGGWERILEKVAGFKTQTRGKAMGGNEFLKDRLDGGQIEISAAEVGMGRATCTGTAPCAPPLSMKVRWSRHGNLAAIPSAAGVLNPVMAARNDFKRFGSLYRVSNKPDPLLLASF